MVVLGLIFVVIAVGFAAGILFGNSETTPLSWYGLTLDGFATLSIYVAGLVTMLVLLVGLWLVRRGLARALRGRRGPATATTATGATATTRGRDRGRGRKDPARAEPAREEPAQEEPAREEPAREEPAREEPAPGQGRTGTEERA